MMTKVKFDDIRVGDRYIFQSTYNNGSIGMKVVVKALSSPAKLYTWVGVNCVVMENIIGDISVGLETEFNIDCLYALADPQEILREIINA